MEKQKVTQLKDVLKVLDNAVFNDIKMSDMFFHVATLQKFSAVIKELEDGKYMRVIEETPVIAAPKPKQKKQRKAKKEETKKDGQL